MKRVYVFMIIMLSVLNASAVGLCVHHSDGDAIVLDTIITDSVFFDAREIDSIASIVNPNRKPVKSYDFSNNPLGKRIGHGFVSFFEKFSSIDSSYIEPQHYNYAAMIQNTNTQEVYRLSNNHDYSVTFAPEWNYKIGPYFGWRWIFLGYTLDINHLDFSHDDRQRQELDMSLYTNLFGIDLYYRKSGNDYKIRRMRLGKGIDTSPMKDVDFHGFKSSVKGFNIYYILNHHKFSYPAAFSQSTVQRRSAGSPLLGFAYTVHKVSVDWKELQSLIDERLDDTFEQPTDSDYRDVNVKYMDISLSGGYAYNWVFAKNWLFSASLSAAVAYKHSYGNTNESVGTHHGFSFHNFGFDAIGRFGLVFNNTKWYAGASATLNAFNYNKSNFSLNTFFGNVNIYVGFNFGRKKDES